MKKVILKAYLEHGLALIGFVIAVISMVLLLTEGVSDLRGYAGIGLGVSIIVIDIARTAWVIRARALVLWEMDYDKLPCFDEMCSVFWVWDINKFITRDYAGSEMFNCLKEKG